MRRAAPLLVLAAVLAAPGAHAGSDDAANARAALSKLESALAEASRTAQSVPQGTVAAAELRIALQTAESHRRRLNDGLRTIADRHSTADSDAGTARRRKIDWESARRQRDWKEKLLDTEDGQLDTEIKAHNAGSASLDQRLADLKRRASGIDAARATLDHSSESAVASFNAAVDAYNRDNQAHSADADAYNNRKERLSKRVLALIEERTKLLPETAAVSKKEREYVEAQAKADAGAAEEAAALAAFASDFEAATAALEEARAALGRVPGPAAPEPPPSPGTGPAPLSRDSTLTGERRTSGDGLGGRKSDPRFSPKDPASPEVGSEKARLGFDRSGPMEGTGVVPEAPIGVPVPDAVLDDPVVREHPELLKDPEVLGKMRELRAYEAQARDAKVAATRAQAKFDDERKTNPKSDQLSVLRVEARMAQDKERDLTNMVKFTQDEVKATVKKKVSFPKIDTGSPKPPEPAGGPPAGMESPKPPTPEATPKAPGAA